MRLALIPQGFTAPGCYLHYVPMAAAEGLAPSSSKFRASRPTLNDTAVLKWSHRPKLHRDLRVTSARFC